MKKLINLVIVFAVMFITCPTYAWYDQTHLAIAKAAGYQSWFNAAGADIAVVKAGVTEEKNHYFNNNKDQTITDKMVLSQGSQYNIVDDEGHLYGAIIGSLREFQRERASGNYAEFHMAFASHYIGDLSQPLHNMPWDDYNKMHHGANDGIVNNDALDMDSEIRKNMYEIIIRKDSFEEDLAREISRIANLSRQLGRKLRTENRNMTKQEALVQLGHSSSLLKSVLLSLK